MLIGLQIMTRNAIYIVKKYTTIYEDRDGLTIFRFLMNDIFSTCFIEEADIPIIRLGWYVFKFNRYD